jgi:hypothetical protein
MLNAQDRVILFCAATGIDHAAVGPRARDAVHGHPGIHRAQSRERGVYAHGQADKSPGRGHSAMINMLLDVNTHF